MESAAQCADHIRCIEMHGGRERGHNAQTDGEESFSCEHESKRIEPSLNES